MDQICPKIEFPAKTKKSEQHHWFLHIQLSLCNKFSNNFRFLDQICAKKIEQHHWILHIWIRLSTKFQLKLIILIFLGLICPKRVFPVKNRKSELHHRVLHIRISLSTKFQLKLLILTFSTKFAQKKISGRKPKKWTASLNSAYSN